MSVARHYKDTFLPLLFVCAEQHIESSENCSTDDIAQEMYKARFSNTKNEGDTRDRTRDLSICSRMLCH